MPSVSLDAGVSFLMLAAAALVALACPTPARAAECEDLGRLFAPGCRRVADTFRDGDNELFVSGYSWHVPATWSPERRAELNEKAWGAGLGRTVEDADGDTHTVYFYGFRDSHRHVQWQAGYAFHRFFGPREGIQPGIGYTVAIVQRPDIWNGVPFPVIVPLAALRYGKGTLETTFIPTLGGGINHGSTLYVFGRIGLE